MTVDLAVGAPADDDLVARPWSAPLTDSQLGLLVVQHSVPAKHLYNVVAEIELDPRHDRTRIRAALAAVLAVQPALRMALHESPEPHATLVEPTDEPALTEVITPAAEFDRRMRDLIAEFARTEFLLDRAPLLRAAWQHTADGTRSTLLIVVHHTVFDGFSLRPLVRDLDAALHGALDAAALRPVRERALRRELDAQRAAAADPSVDASAAALGERLRRTPATLLHPRPNRPADTDFAGRRRELRLGRAASDAVDAACARLGTTPFVFFSAVYAAVLARHSANDTVTFGSPMMARRTIGSFDLCGFFVNTLPVTVDVSWDLSFADHVRAAVQPATDAARRRTAVPFSQIVRHADPDRSTSRNPLFSVMLAMQDATTVQPGGSVLALREHGTDTAKFDLWLGVTPAEDGWLLELEHDTTLLPESIVDGLATSLSEAVRRASADVSTRLADLFADASADLTTATDGYRHEPDGADLDTWLRRTAARAPNATAVQEPGRTLTYRELAAAADAVALGLHRRGVRPGTVVGLTTGTLTDTVVAMLAVLRLGAAYLPLDLTAPTERLAYMIGRAECALVIGTGEFEVPVHEPAELAAGSDGGELPARPAGSGGYVMFTSGSTGHPKGVAMPDGPLLNLTAWQVDALDMTERTRFLQYAPLGFDVSFQEIVPTLVAGGTVVSREPADRRDLAAVVRRVIDTEVSHVYLPVAALRPFVREAVRANARFDRLTHVCVSGEQLIVDEQVERFFADRPHLALVNLYGPTETHAVTTYRLRGDDRGWPSHVPIGRPITGVTAQVVDRTGHLAPVGVPGELLLGGRCPADGYRGDTEQTRARFLPDPHGPAGARRYRTGDQVLWSADGDLVFLGRDDQQVKIRGHRVELGDIEATANAIPGVAQAVGAARGDGSDRHLLLFLRREPGASVTPALVTERLSAALPGYMVPTRVLLVDTVPTTGNGKVDRAALLGLADRLIAADRDSEPREHSAPTDPLERWLLELWTELLGRDDLSTGRSLLECGAHSLNVLTALGRIETERGVRVPVLDFFRAPTVTALAALVRANTTNGSRS